MEMISEVDDNGNGEIEFEEFAILMSKRMGKTEDEETLKEAFKILDMDSSGQISRGEPKEIMRGFSRAGEDIGDDEIDVMLQQADVDGDGEISMDEFCKVMMNDGN